MNILGLIIIYVFADKICKSMEKIIKKEDIGLSPIEEMIVASVILICSVVILIVLISIPIILFF